MGSLYPGQPVKMAEALIGLPLLSCFGHVGGAALLLEQLGQTMGGIQQGYDADEGMRGGVARSCSLPHR